MILMKLMIVADDEAERSRRKREKKHKKHKKSKKAKKHKKRSRVRTTLYHILCYNYTQL